MKSIRFRDTYTEISIPKKRDLDNYRANMNKPSNSVGKEVRVLFINAKRGNHSQWAILKHLVVSQKM